jgi:hypothetical protein
MPFGYARPASFHWLGRNSHVIVNGVTVIEDGEHTGAKPGKALFGHGRKNQ